MTVYIDNTNNNVIVHNKDGLRLIDIISDTPGTLYITKYYRINDTIYPIDVAQQVPTDSSNINEVITEYIKLSFVPEDNSVTLFKVVVILGE